MKAGRGELLVVKVMLPSENEIEESRHNLLVKSAANGKIDL